MDQQLHEIRCKSLWRWTGLTWLSFQQLVPLYCLNEWDVPKVFDDLQFLDWGSPKTTLTSWTPRQIALVLFWRYKSAHSNSSGESIINVFLCNWGWTFGPCQDKVYQSFHNAYSWLICRNDWYRLDECSPKIPKITDDWMFFCFIWHRFATLPMFQTVSLFEQLFENQIQTVIASVLSTTRLASRFIFDFHWVCDNIIYPQMTFV